ncbi:MAG: hypothetical protein FRX49_05233 [Trebouxia sp. A1-2]|nr:MAG: hypothetical protein FRX49_05233 [Trebouxia sp. A1-2]
MTDRRGLKNSLLSIPDSIQHRVQQKQQFARKMLCCCITVLRKQGDQKSMSWGQKPGATKHDKQDSNNQPTVATVNVGNQTAWHHIPGTLIAHPRGIDITGKWMIPHMIGVRCLVGVTVSVYDSSVSRFRDWSKE